MSSYRIEIEARPDAEGGGFLATVPELPGCVSDGATWEEAAANAEGAIREWIAAAEAMGRPVPLPDDDDAPRRRLRFVDRLCFQSCPRPGPMTAVDARAYRGELKELLRHRHFQARTARRRAVERRKTPTAVFRTRAVRLRW